MSVIKYQFLPDIFRDQKTNKLGGIYRPYVLVKLGNDKKWSNNFIKSLLDSGADNNVFPASFATEIGINYKKGTLVPVTVVGGQKVDSYVNFVKMKVENKEFETVIQFGENIQIPLLGREGFFNYFDYVKFNVKRKFFEIKF